MSDEDDAVARMGAYAALVGEMDQVQAWDCVSVLQFLENDVLALDCDSCRCRDWCTLGVQNRARQWKLAGRYEEVRIVGKMPGCQ